MAALCLDDDAGSEVRPLAQRSRHELLTPRIQVERRGVDQSDAGLEGRVQRTHRQILVQIAVAGTLNYGFEADPGGADPYGCHLNTSLAQPLARQCWSLGHGTHEPHYPPRSLPDADGVSGRDFIRSTA